MPLQRMSSSQMVREVLISQRDRERSPSVEKGRILANPHDDIKPCGVPLEEEP